MKIIKAQHREHLALTRKPALVETLTTGTMVTSANEDSVLVDVTELEPFVKVIKQSRSSTVYDKVE